MRCLLAITAAMALGLTVVLGATSTLAAPPRHRVLPAGHHWGRCLLVVHGQTRISGRCIYELNPDGGFHIDGPRQVFDGIDYPRAEIMAAMISTDYWANVFRDDDGTWTGYANEDVGDVHGAPPFDPLRREGACFVNNDVRICLWRTRSR